MKLWCSNINSVIILQTSKYIYKVYELIYEKMSRRTLSVKHCEMHTDECNKEIVAFGINVRISALC